MISFGTLNCRGIFKLKESVHGCSSSSYFKDIREQIHRYIWHMRLPAIC